MKQDVWLAPVTRISGWVALSTPLALTLVMANAWRVPALANSPEEPFSTNPASSVPPAAPVADAPQRTETLVSNAPAQTPSPLSPTAAAVTPSVGTVPVPWGAAIAQNLPSAPPLPVSVPVLQERVFEAPPTPAPASTGAPVYVLVVPPTTPGAIPLYPGTSLPSGAPAAYPVPAYPVPTTYAVPGGYPTPGSYPAPMAAPAPMVYAAPGSYPAPMAVPTPMVYGVPGYPAPGMYAAPGAYPNPTVAPVPTGYGAPVGYPAATVYPAPTVAPAPGVASSPSPVAQSPAPTIPTTALTPPSLTFQGVAIYAADDFSARARVAALYPLSPRVLVGGTLDFITGDETITDLGDEGVDINELYVTLAPESVPNLRFTVGQVDLTSYFDRNSFAKDGASQFFNDIFQTNPALAAANIDSRPGVVVNWSLNDNLEARVAGFSSAESIGDFQLDGFAGELGFRVGNAILRGTYVSSRDTDADGADSDRLEAYGLNAETFIPDLNLGLFARYGQLNSQGEDFEADTYSLGVSLLDLFTPNDRLGLAYGRNLSDEVNRDRNNPVPDALELFYDFPVLPNLRLGFTLQQIDNFSETIAGVRVRTDFDLIPRSR